MKKRKDHSPDFKAKVWLEASLGVEPSIIQATDGVYLFDIEGEKMVL